MSNGDCADQMAAEIVKHGPITGMFFVHQSFTSYKSGVYHVAHPLHDPMLGLGIGATRAVHTSRCAFSAQCTAEIAALRALQVGTRSRSSASARRKAPSTGWSPTRGTTSGATAATSRSAAARSCRAANARSKTR